MSMKLSKHIQNKLEQLLANTGDMALKRRARRIIEEIDPKDGDVILDLGCGDGYYLHILSNLPVKLTLYGSDYDESGLKRAKKNLNGKKINLKHGDLMKKLPYKANTFDKIIMSEVAEHLPDDVKGFSEIKRVLKKGGRIVATVPNHNYPLFWDPVNRVLEDIFDTHIVSGFFAGLWNQHERLYTPKQLEKVVKKAGLQVKHLESTTWWCLPFNHYLVNIVARMLASNSFDESTHEALNKFSKQSKKPVLIDVAFSFVNKLDTINDIWTPKNRGVGVLIVGEK